ncbi:bifunctional histidinol-phosphatase/imidazoleglycerol-phosphate dehydratase HisB [Candidatus Pantoea edessiphila]|uniref:Histidine biosynthesis bifunctional protein HisB n=1 Tax=Candidatus Pantoea edessiphila TaxID=2044610 RepID=A0A2P5SWP4_9GAMM|nr:bifunctional histidinol-phosphatase/imidazoleglycerol-phosphate dehydratase HisB [Candidatus Pantoea edessiphila]PPI86742.1 bifunctional histidinol-phosphatase/imidazoleglycerol-phosphate dehydratase [Candidatus Pantoea edessiphila]
MNQKTLFIDRDGTIIAEPAINFQVDHISKLHFEPNVISALLSLQTNGYNLVMITNQDGLGTINFPKINFDGPHNLMIQIFKSQGVVFDDILICPHTKEDNCCCRKPKTKMVEKWLRHDIIDKNHSYVIGDRSSDLQLAHNMGIKSIRYGKKGKYWNEITKYLISLKRYAKIERNTKETKILIEIWLDIEGQSSIHTGIGFFDHMLEQISIQGGFCMNVNVKGDLYIDDHHTVEDTGIVLGQALLKALGDKIGIGRYGFILPMDECLSKCILDISGRPYINIKAKFNHQHVGDLSTQMIQHFFSSISYGMMSTIHLKTKGKNDHHMAESLFKVFGRTLRQAIRLDGNILPSSKGIL